MSSGEQIRTSIFEPNPKRNIKKITIKVGFWWLGNIGFGLIPLLTVTAANLFNVNPKANKITADDINHIINDGGINFFCLALIGSIAVDIYNTKESFEPTFVRIMKWASITVGIIIAGFYLAFVLTNEKCRSLWRQSTVDKIFGIYSRFILY